MNKKLSLIAAVSKNNIIGNGLDIPWKIKGEQKRFKNLTLNKTIIMGRKTYESIGKPLPNRKTIVVSRSNVKIDGVTVCNSIEEVLDNIEGEAFVVGGSEIYKMFLPYCDLLYITTVEADVEGDIYFPDIDYEKYKEIYCEKIESNISYVMKTFIRKD
jgi:dihydrofolate reductase (trimethoprim resistance protein)